MEVLIRTLVIATVLGGVGVLSLQGRAGEEQKLAGWHPTQPTSAAARFVGDQQCAECHQEKVTTHRGTGMALALATGSTDLVLRANPRLNFRHGSYTYSIERRGEQSVYTVSDGREVVSEPILWAFGHGAMGQTYVFRHRGTLYESRVSFYSAIKGLDITLGAPRAAPASLVEAAGREMKTADIQECFGCHATDVTRDGRVQLDRMTPGVRCEACHGPGERHVALMKQGTFTEKGLTGLRGLTTEEQSNFCGACHRTWEQVMLMPGQGGRDNVRFQPYRLTNSPCYDTEDRRISCTACHDPHREVVREASFYDRKCLACHTPGATVAAQKKLLVCRVGKEQCTSCHMPKVELPGAHFKFTDHHIRRPGGDYPL